jgi:PQQ-dependent dehydrogenase (methanol/ethanol family)
MPEFRSPWSRTFMYILPVALLFAIIGARAGSVSGQSADWNSAPSRDFPLAGGDYANQRYSALDQINTSNIGKLGGAWSIHLEETGAAGNLDGTPIVIDGVMYVSTARLHVLAIDAATGKIRWRYRPASETRIGANKGVAVADGKVFVGRRDNVLVGLDQQTGQTIWETKLTDHPAAYTSAAPVYYDGRIYIGTAGGDNGARGNLGAYDAKTGRELWKFLTIPGRGDRFADTWEGDSYKIGGGGIWNHVAIDPELGLVYMGVGNAAPDVCGGSRGGDNLFTASVVALDLKTGAYKWHFQEVHHDIWDYDAASPPVLADLRYRGRLRKVLLHAGKTGFLYILDRANGKPLTGIEERPVPQEPKMKTARTQPFPIGDRFVPLCPEQLLEGFERGCLFNAFWDQPILIFPGTSGGNAWAPITFSPKTNLVYIPANLIPTAFTAKRQVWDEATQRLITLGDALGFYRPPGLQRSGTLTAMDPTTNKVVWHRRTKYPMGGGSGLLSTAGGLLFHGESDGNLVAYDIKNGDELWKFQTGAGANAPVSTFAVNGEQYVAVLSGGNALYMSQRGDLLWAFKLGGTVPQAAPPREPPLIQPGPESPAPQQTPTRPQ